MSMKSIKSDLSDGANIENENEIIEEEIIKNSLLDIREDIEEDYDEEDDINEENYLEKNKTVGETYDNKLSLNENENKKENNIISDNNKQKTIQIYQDIIENLLIELFEHYYNELSKEKNVNLRNRILEYKYHIELFCSKLSVNFSIYLLCILEKKISELNEYTFNMINKKQNVSLQEILKIKQSLKLTGKDINEIFQKPFQKTKNYFDISSVIVVSFITNILNSNYAKEISEQEYKQITEIESIEEKDNFEKYVEKWKSSLYILDEAEQKNESEINEDKNIGIINEEKKQNDKTFEIKNKEENENNNTKIKIINNQKCKIIYKNNNEICENKKSIEQKQENFSNLEDLMEYINGNDNKKKRKKKRKKKTKQKAIQEEKKENKEEKDLVFENFKSNLINYSENLKNVTKIKPKISEAFLEKLKLIN